MTKLWTPQKVMPTERKREGGSHFDDEMVDTETVRQQVMIDMARLIDHINKRRDHTVYVSGAEEREQLRQVFNSWYMNSMIDHHPNIRIEYGVKQGSIRVAE